MPFDGYDPLRDGIVPFRASPPHVFRNYKEKFLYSEYIEEVWNWTIEETEALVEAGFGSVISDDVPTYGVLFFRCNPTNSTFAIRFLGSPESSLQIFTAIYNDKNIDIRSSSVLNFSEGFMGSDKEIRGVTYNKDIAGADFDSQTSTGARVANGDLELLHLLLREIPSDRVSGGFNIDGQWIRTVLNPHHGIAVNAEDELDSSTESAALLFKLCGFPDIGMNLYRPMYPGLVKGKEAGEVIYLDLLRAKADKKVTDDSIIGRYHILDFEDKLWEFDTIHLLAVGGNNAFGKLLFAKDTGDILVTDLYLRPLLQTTLPISTIDEYIDFDKKKESFVDGGAGGDSYFLHPWAITGITDSQDVKQILGFGPTEITLTSSPALLQSGKRQRPEFFDSATYSNMPTDAVFFYANRFYLDTSNKLYGFKFIDDPDNPGGFKFIKGKLICELDHSLIDEDTSLNIMEQKSIKDLSNTTNTNELFPPLATIYPTFRELTLVTQDIPNPLNYKFTYPGRYASNDLRILIPGAPYTTQEDFENRSEKIVHTKDLISLGTKAVEWELINPPQGASIEVKEDNRKATLSLPNDHKTFRVDTLDGYKYLQSICSTEPAPRRSKIFVKVWPKTIPVSRFGDKDDPLTGVKFIDPDDCSAVVTGFPATQTCEIQETAPFDASLFGIMGLNQDTVHHFEKFELSKPNTLGVMYLRPPKPFELALTCVDLGAIFVADAFGGIPFAQPSTVNPTISTPTTLATLDDFTQAEIDEFQRMIDEGFAKTLKYSIGITNTGDTLYQNFDPSSFTDLFAGLVFGTGSFPSGCKSFTPDPAAGSGGGGSDRLVRFQDGDDLSGVDGLYNTIGTEVSNSALLQTTTPGNGTTAAVPLFYLFGRKAGPCRFTLTPKDTSEDPIILDIEVWDVRKDGEEGSAGDIPTIMNLPVGDADPTKFTFKITGNSSYPHKWAVSDPSVASITVDPDDSRTATIIPRSAGSFWFKAMDSAEMPWESGLITVE